MIIMTTLHIAIRNLKPKKTLKVSFPIDFSAKNILKESLVKSLTMVRNINDY